MTVLGLIRREFHSLDPISFWIIYKTYIRPHLEYAIQAWSPYFSNDIECLERMQHRATKLVRGFAKLSQHEDRLKRLTLTTLEDR
jgi:hypothetical protein